MNIIDTLTWTVCWVAIGVLIVTMIEKLSVKTRIWFPLRVVLMVLWPITLLGWFVVYSVGFFVGYYSTWKIERHRKRGDPITWPPRK